ncbi:MAG: NADH-quinone oxidoreductase subunit J [Bdellovibrionales bacterium]|nr:NADH-quinone oxidoreductase subunit J [Bdellovibrionales bacterium]
MIDYPLLAFSAFSTIAILGSLMVIFKKNPVASAFALVAVFFSFAGLYALMSAHLVAALQILVYTGAIMVLFVFVIMLLNQDRPVEDFKSSSGIFKLLSGIAVSGFVFALVKVALLARSLTPRGDMTEEKISELGGNVKAIAESLFSDHVLQFEITSFLILAAIVATIALAKRKAHSGRGHS